MECIRTKKKFEIDRWSAEEKNVNEMKDERESKKKWIYEKRETGDKWKSGVKKKLVNYNKGEEIWDRWLKWRGRKYD